MALSTIACDIFRPATPASRAGNSCFLKRPATAGRANHPNLIAAKTSTPALRVCDRAFVPFPKPPESPADRKPRQPIRRHLAAIEIQRRYRLAGDSLGQKSFNSCPDKFHFTLRFCGGKDFDAFATVCRLDSAGVDKQVFFQVI